MLFGFLIAHYITVKLQPEQGQNVVSFLRHVILCTTALLGMIKIFKYLDKNKLVFNKNNLYIFTYVYKIMLSILSFPFQHTR